jgi:hypothetical protein
MIISNILKISLVMFLLIMFSNFGLSKLYLDDTKQNKTIISKEDVYIEYNEKIIQDSKNINTIEDRIKIEVNPNRNKFNIYIDSENNKEYNKPAKLIFKNTNFITQPKIYKLTTTEQKITEQINIIDNKSNEKPIYETTIIDIVNREYLGTPLYDKTNDYYYFYVDGFSEYELTDDLVSYWKFDEEQNGLIAEDSHGSNNGTLSNSRIFGTEGKINKGADFTKGDDDITFSTFSGVKTISFWFHPTVDIVSDSTSAWVFGSSTQYYPAIIMGYVTGSITGEFISILTAGGGKGWNWKFNDVIGGNRLNKDTWYYIVIYWNSSDNFYYLSFDGGTPIKAHNQGGSATNDILANTPNPSFNNLFWAPHGNNFYVDEFAIWTKALSEDEIDELYNNGNGFEYPFKFIDININTPTKNEIYYTKNQLLNFTIETTEILNITLEINNQNTTLKTNYNETSYNYTENHTFIEGVNNVCVYSISNEINKTECITFNISILYPTLDILSPINNNKYNNKTQLILINVSDDYHLFNITYEINNINYTNLNNTNFNFFEGNNKLKVYVTNTENKTTIDEINFVIDTTPPSLLISSPVNNNRYEELTIDIIISASDINNVDKIWYIIDNITYNYTLPTNYTFGNGTQILKVYANDTLGNTAFKEISFITGYDRPIIDNIIIGKCPTTKQPMINLWIIIIICVFIGFVGIYVKQPILPIILGFGLIILSLSLFDCGEILSYNVLVLGVLYIYSGVTIKK